MLKKTYLKSWPTDAWSGRLDSRHLDGWTLDASTLGIWTTGQVCSTFLMLHLTKYFTVQMYPLQTNKLTQPLSTLEVTIILRDGSQSSIVGALQNIRNMSLKSKKFGAKNTIILGLVYTTRINIGILGKIWYKFFGRNAVGFMSIKETRGKNLCKDGPHLIEQSKIILAKNLIFGFNKVTSKFLTFQKSIHIIDLSNLKENHIEETCVQQLQN